MNNNMATANTRSGARFFGRWVNIGINIFKVAYTYIYV